MIRTWQLRDFLATRSPVPSSPGSHGHLHPRSPMMLGKPKPSSVSFQGKVSDSSPDWLWAFVRVELLGSSVRQVSQAGMQMTLGWMHGVKWLRWRVLQLQRQHLAVNKLIWAPSDPRKEVTRDVKGIWWKSDNWEKSLCIDCETYIAYLLDCLKWKVENNGCHASSPSTPSSSRRPIAECSIRSQRDVFDVSSFQAFSSHDSFLMLVIVILKNQAYLNSTIGSLNWIRWTSMLPIVSAKSQLSNIKGVKFGESALWQKMLTVKHFLMF